MSHDEKRGEYTHLRQPGERLKTMFTDDTWDLVEDANKTKGNLPLWLIHRCTKEPIKVQRYEDIIHLPCEYCGEVCPIPLQGLYNMVRWL
jgi:hypothetical protein